MMDTLETVKQKIARIERELAEVRQDLERLASPQESQGPKSHLIPVQWVDRRNWPVWFNEWFQEMGIRAQPVGAEKLQGMMLRDGIRPEDNLLSRGIIAMRDE